MMQCLLALQMTRPNVPMKVVIFYYHWRTDLPYFCENLYALFEKRPITIKLN